MTPMLQTLRRRAAIAVTAIAALSLCSCVATNTAVVQQDSRLDQLEEDVQRLKRFADLSQADPAAKPGADSSTFERLAELAQRVDQMEASLQQLSGNVEDMERTSRKAAQDKPADASAQLAPLRDELAALTIKVNGLSQQVARLSSSVTSTGTVQTDPGKTRQPERTYTDHKVLYNEAYDLYQQGKYDESREKFNLYVKQFPDTDLTDNALLWIGEGYYDQGLYEQAILKYDKLIQDFPNGDKVPSALLKQAFAFHAIGDPQDAKILLRKIIQEYPESEQANIAKKKLEILGD